ncbi:MAG: type II secretion system protein [Planctomycetota bacterium]
MKHVLDVAHARRRALAARRSKVGFTLIELLAVILIIGILAVALLPMVTGAIEEAKVTASEANLRNVYSSMLIYENKYGRLPSKSGVRFFAELYQKKAMEQTKTNAERLTCPGVDIGALTIGDLPWEEWWTDLDAIDGSYSAYAGRDCKNFPLRKLSGKEVLVATDNDPYMNFETTTLALYGDGSVHRLEVGTLQDEGILDLEETYLAVGPDSPLEDLQKLSLD